MNFNFRLIDKETQKEISILEAHNKNMIWWISSGIAISDDVILLRSTNITDEKGAEIFEGDVINDKEGKLYNIIYKSGIFLIKLKDSDEGCPLISLSSLKMGNMLDGFLVAKNDNIYYN